MLNAATLDSPESFDLSSVIVTIRKSERTVLDYLLNSSLYRDFLFCLTYHHFRSAFQRPIPEAQNLF